MAFERGSLIGSIAISVAYLAGYVFLDWVSFVFPLAPYGVTPWNPPTGLSLALVLLVGLRAARGRSELGQCDSSRSFGVIAMERLANSRRAILDWRSDRHLHRHAVRPVPIHAPASIRVVVGDRLPVHRHHVGAVAGVLGRASQPVPMVLCLVPTDRVDRGPFGD